MGIDLDVLEGKSELGGGHLWLKKLVVWKCPALVPSVCSQRINRKYTVAAGSVRFDMVHSLSHTVFVLSEFLFAMHSWKYRQLSLDYCDTKDNIT